MYHRIANSDLARVGSVAVNEEEHSKLYAAKHQHEVNGHNEGEFHHGSAALGRKPLPADASSHRSFHRARMLALPAIWMVMGIPAKWNSNGIEALVCTATY